MTPKSENDDSRQFPDAMDTTSQRHSAPLTDMLALLLDSTGEGIFGVDENGKCTFINRAALAMLGYDNEEVIGKNTHSLFHFTQQNGTPLFEDDCPVCRTSESGKSYLSSNEILWSKDGSSFPAEISSYPIVEKDTVKGRAILFRNVAATRAMERRVNFLTNHDCLTGLINRYEFERRLEEAIDSARFYKIEHVLGYMDIDQFKVINDTCGHKAGDELLRQLGALLLQSIRREDSFARLGGDEFGLLLRQCPMEQANRVIDKMRKALSAFQFVWKESTFAVTFSIGLVAITQETQNRENAMSSADSACYMAKDSGRNRVHIYQADDVEIVQRHGEMQWVSRIHEALADNRLVLRQQKIARSYDADSFGDCCEILVSMLDKEGKLIPPGAFLPAAERFNLMPAIDRWVVRAALKWLTTNTSRLQDLDMCSINLSGITLCDQSFQQYVLNEMGHQRIPPEKICFEITETAAINSLSTATSFINTMRQQGYRFALDDFGSGLASFGYLKDLPVDYLKIDGSFVVDLENNPVNQAIVTSINQIGHVMNLKTIAEHAENDAVLAILKTIGVDYVQGYGVGRPELIPRS